MTWNTRKRPSSEANVSDDGESAHQSALRILGGADQSESRLRAKLKRLGFSEASIGLAVDKLIEIGLVNDHRLATGIAESRAAHGYGKPFIAADLRKRGLNRTAIDQALAELNDDVVTDGMASRVKASKANGGTQADLAKLQRQLQRRGHSGSAIRQALADLPVTSDR
jgi:SOS response regulatory protein OraA/RecX